MADVSRGAAIVGIHEHITRYAPDKSELQLQGESIIKALDDAGLTKNDVDGLLTASMSIDQARKISDLLRLLAPERHLGRAFRRLSAARLVSNTTQAPLMTADWTSAGSHSHWACSVHSKISRLGNNLQ